MISSMAAFASFSTDASECNNEPLFTTEREIHDEILNETSSTSAGEQFFRQDVERTVQSLVTAVENNFDTAANLNHVKSFEIKEPDVDRKRKLKENVYQNSADKKFKLSDDSFTCVLKPNAEFKNESVVNTEEPSTSHDCDAGTDANFDDSTSCSTSDDNAISSTAPSCSRNILENSKGNETCSSGEASSSSSGYRLPSGPNDIIIPLIGRPIDHSRLKPISAEQAEYLRRDGILRIEQERIDPGPPCMPQNMSNEEKEQQQKIQTKEAKAVGIQLMELAIKMMKAMESDILNTRKLARQMRKFHDLPVSPIALEFAPQFVNTIMFILSKGTDVPSFLHKMAEGIYLHCHSMYMIPEGYNFVTVFHSAVKKRQPEVFEEISPVEYDIFDEDSDDSGWSSDEDGVCA